MIHECLAIPKFIFERNINIVIFYPQFSKFENPPSRNSDSQNASILLIPFLIFIFIVIFPKLLEILI